MSVIAIISVCNNTCNFSLAASVITKEIVVGMRLIQCNFAQMLSVFREG